MKSFKIIDSDMHIMEPLISGEGTSIHAQKSVRPSQCGFPRGDLNLMVGDRTAPKYPTRRRRA
jgi:hypothetical protein